MLSSHICLIMLIAYQQYCSVVLGEKCVLCCSLLSCEVYVMDAT